MGLIGLYVVENCQCMNWFTCDLLLAHPELLPCIGGSKVTECQAFRLMYVCLSKPIVETAMDSLCLCVFIHCRAAHYIEICYCKGLL